MADMNNRASSSVDVVVPCYRYGRFLRQCVESVLAQSLENIRVLIIDDASPDNTAEVAADLARESSRITFSRHTSNKGHIETYNEGIEWASGDYFLLLSADDYLLAGALQRAAELMDAHREVGFTFGKAIDLRDLEARTETVANTAVASVIEGGTSSVLSGEDFFALIESVHSVNVVRTPTAVIRTELQKRLGGYRRELPHTGDLEMWLRLAAHASVGVLAPFQAVSRFHGNNMQGAYYRRYLPDLEQRKAAIDCFIDSCSAVLQNTRQLHRRLVTPLAYEAIQCAHCAFNDGDLAIVRQLREFAVNLDTGVRKTMPWAMLTCKQQMGIGLWRAFTPAVRRLRRRSRSNTKA